MRRYDNVWQNQPDVEEDIKVRKREMDMIYVEIISSRGLIV